jgi:hypothetical protein
MRCMFLTSSSAWLCVRARRPVSPIGGAGGPVPNTKWRAPKGVSYTLYWARGSRRINWARQGGCRQVSGSQGPLRPHNEYRHLGRNETSHSAGGTPGAVGSNDLDPGEAGAEKPGTPKGHCRKHTSTRSSTQQGPGQVNGLDFISTDLEIEPQSKRIHRARKVIMQTARDTFELLPASLSLRAARSWW